MVSVLLTVLVTESARSFYFQHPGLVPLYKDAIQLGLIGNLAGLVGGSWLATHVHMSMTAATQLVATVANFLVYAVVFLILGGIIRLITMLVRR